MDMAELSKRSIRVRGDDMRSMIKSGGAKLVVDRQAGRHRTLAPARLAMPQPAICTPRLRRPTLRTHKPIRPSDPFQIRRAVFLCRKPLEKLLERPRIRVRQRPFHAPHTTCCGHLSQSATHLGHWGDIGDGDVGDRYFVALRCLASGPRIGKQRIGFERGGDLVGQGGNAIQDGGIERHKKTKALSFFSNRRRGTARRRERPPHRHCGALVELRTRVGPRGRGPSRAWSWRGEGRRPRRPLLPHPCGGRPIAPYGAPTNGVAKWTTGL